MRIRLVDVSLAMPGDGQGGFVLTVLLGIAGAIVGRFIATGIGTGNVGGFDLRSFPITIGGAMLPLVGYRLMRKSCEPLR
jgi:uncharacterized membrane protein YeaQ/YmgE (transglycosylase-associated protein family)